MGFSLKKLSPVRLVQSVAKALPAPPPVIKKIATAPQAVNVKVMNKAMANATKTLPPALAKLSNNVSSAVVIADKSIVKGKMPTRAENLQAARGVATVAAVVGAAYVGVAGLAKLGASAVKAGGAAMKAKQALEARKAQKLSAAEAASVDAELARVNEQIAVEQRADKAAAVAPDDEQKKNGQALAFAGAGLLALKVLAFV